MRRQGRKMRFILVLILVAMIGIFAVGCKVWNSSEDTEKTGSDATAEEKDTSDPKDAESDDTEGDDSAGNITAEVDSHGIVKLHVDTVHLSDSLGNAVQLRGVSTHGLAWYPQYVNAEAFQTLRDDWGANVVRLAMYTNEYGGYCAGGDREKLKQLVRDGVEEATNLGMYVIVDWHILSDCNPMTNKEEAKAFFTEMSAEFRSYDNVIYEICNEPQNSPWDSVIKPYAEEVIPCIRANDSDAIILVGTNTWSQDIDEVVGNQLDDANTMYVVHFYAGTHKDDLRNRVKSALDAGVPVFVSECSISDASGNGSLDYESGQAWVDLLNSYQVSFVTWSLSNKEESSALLRSDCTSISGWSDEELSDAGKWWKQRIHGQ